tara:strand:+ start:172 stop:729 length:558 start_codon:yes stop_codon:yes gene_type:complete
MRLKLIQSSETSINSIYIIEDFLDDTNLLNKLTKKIENYTQVDAMSYKTNVKASMTTFDKLLKDNEFNFFHKKILDTLAFVYTIRSPHPNENIKLMMTNSWGMRHQKFEKTLLHIHSTFHWSGAFYLNVPSDNISMYFPDFGEKISLKNNMLVFFNGNTKHAVDCHESKEDRISMAFNVKMEVNY